MLKFRGIVLWRLGTRASGTPRTFSITSTAIQTNKFEAKQGFPEAKSSDEDIDDANNKNKSLVAAAFASLNDQESEDNNKPSPKSAKLSQFQKLNSQISKASSVDSLLVVAENPVVSRRHALKMVSILSEWSSTNKVKISDFEKDARFLKLCRILARTPTAQAMSSLTMAEDLSTVLGITGDDEAARLIDNLSLPQMIKVMKALDQKGRRSTPLLRALSFNITKQSETIDLKKSADLLFSMVSLNFPDPVLLDRICSDVIESLPSNTDKPAVVTSIVVSLGLLKYRHEGVLSAITDWIQDHKSLCRASDIASTVVTLATVDYEPPGSEVLFEIATSLKEEELTKTSAWVDLVFSLLTLDRVQQSQLASTLDSDFIDKLLSSGEISVAARRKLMAIDAYLQLTSPSSPRLPEEISVGVPIMYTKEKTLFVQSIMDTFKSLVSADTFVKKHCNSGMGFLYDAEFAVNAKCHPVSLEKAKNDKSVFRIAVMGLDYHDMCRCTVVPLGINNLYKRLLEMKGFKVLQVPYTEFNPKDKLITRVKYLENSLKEIINTDKSL